jgi:nucleoside-diphosphate-sugar epimerase
VRDIIHLAAALIPTCAAQPALGVRVNVDGFNHVLEVARVIVARRVVWASSIAVYGPQSRYDGEPDEDAPHWPTTVYGACKSMNEYMARHYYDAFGVDSIGLRFTVVYGAWRMRGALAYRLGQELIEKPAHGQPARVPAGDGLVNWQHVEDAAHAILLSLRHVGPTKHRVFNTGGEAVRVRDAAAVACCRMLASRSRTGRPRGSRGCRSRAPPPSSGTVRGTTLRPAPGKASTSTGGVRIFRRFDQNQCRHEEAM